MLQHFGKIKTGYVILLTVVFFGLISCNSGESTVSYEDGANEKVSDSIREINSTNTGASPFDDGAINKFPNLTEEERAERQKLINMQIDSTYAAITMLDELKAEINTETSTVLTVAERNKKSKAIFNINIIQNELTRALDASILANLKLRTNELAGITAELEKNVNHLQHVTDNLNKATKTITRLIDILTYGLTRGWIKPLTPKGASPAEVKAAAS
ncbi:MAG: hypothetical protein WBP16_06290 [Ferruginibacter sp.]